ncbi:MAG: exodeoxyribonuclease VII large subunit [Candidatus Marinimicrobia bacterium]|jgi:exodeoxyribonuclease VII large subunit|nr:exodeoxyribonuclease VII large subunit [Candidatus Neomarinimicrobiota bacterium]MBT3945065.1 exodeoxyribonuclease VII large subunit [Candidatus Neomarinimicrobiota bacterium]MBT4155514.1 exodeoxyribonuclease VII large subunit [Candidatus Neomarinimicrobiota bacterium]MBT4554413.1 exodeoxyribonuclease VII large subunit [Candidatus Neomarinimicrobiota bacterium]MBT4754018.1 exodeoxyribonuclease VII large subunit [Candidatus Neomarinimicrobiota bacterium]|tara:strand:- start:15590 stop:16801 length:1212 start_codon:yes stop_codon:yes gene_type:complete
MPELRSLYTVSELNAQIRLLLEKNFSDIWVAGEISNFHHHPSSGHMYFTLKDRRGEMRCVLFRGNNQFLKFKPSDGMEVRVYGTVTVYEQRGQVQFKVSRMEPAGLGDLYKAFEALKKSLSDEGLFDAIHKKLLPQYPKRIGVVTSGSGAALKDILNVLSRRAPNVKVILRSAKVQGDGSAQEISEAILDLNEYNLVDLIIVGRGGGSIEDLWSFNEESVARSIFRSEIPIISAVGHETDFTISDFVADLRAPTPSAAAELACIPTENILKSFSDMAYSLSRAIQNKVDKSWIRIDHFENRITVQQPQKRIKRHTEKLFKLHHQFIQSITVNHSQLVEKTESLKKRLISLGPNQVLDRGYSIAFTEKGTAIRKSTDISVGESFLLKTGDGEFGAEKTKNPSTQ